MSSQNVCSLRWYAVLSALLLCLVTGCKQTLTAPAEVDPSPLDSSFFWTASTHSVTFERFDTVTNGPLVHTLTFSGAASDVQINDQSVNGSHAMHAENSDGYTLLGGIDASTFLRIKGDDFIMLSDTIAYRKDTMKIESIIRTSDGTIVVGTDVGGIYYYDRGASTWKGLALASSPHVTALACDSAATFATTTIFAGASTGIYSIKNGQIVSSNLLITDAKQLVVGTSDKKFYNLLIQTPSNVYYNFLPNVLLYSLNAGKLFVGATVTAVAVDRNPKTIYVGVYNAGTYGILSFNEASGTYQVPSYTPLSNIPVRAIVASADKNLARAITANILYTTTNGGESWSVTGQYSKGGFTSLALGAHTYIGTEKEGVLTYDGGVFSPVTGFPSRNVAFLYAFDKYLIAANEEEIVTTSDAAGSNWSVSKPTIIETQFLRTPGSFRVLKAGMKVSDTWNAGTYAMPDGNGSFLPLPLTARVMAHYDEVTTKSAVDNTKQYVYHDVYAVRFAYESSPNTVSGTLTSWTVYFAKNRGPVLIEESLNGVLITRTYCTSE